MAVPSLSPKPARPQSRLQHVTHRLAWRGRLGQLGHDGDQSEHFPRRLTALSAVHVRQIAAGPTHSVCSGGDGAAYTFGTTPHGVMLRLRADTCRASHTELPYEPRARYCAMARQLRVQCPKPIL